MFKKGNFVLMNMKGEITTDGIFDALFKNSRENTIIILSKEGIISDVNKAFCQKFGYSPSDVIGKYFNIFFNDRDIQKGLPEQELEEVKEKGSAEDNNYLVNKDGTETWVSGESILVKNDVGDEYILKIIQNIHPIKELQHTLKKEYEFSHNIIMSINDSLIVIDDKYNIHKYNNSFCTLFNWKVDNKNLKEDNFILFNEHNFIDALDNLLLRGKESEVEINYNDKILLVKLNSLTEKYNPKRYLILIQDISDKVNSDKQKDDMIAFVAHELRNPMSSIIICNELLEDSIKENNHEETMMLLNKEKQNLARLKLLISELHEASKAGTGNLQFHKSTFNLKEVVKECIETEKYIHSNYTIECITDEDIEITGDSDRIGQVITNYLSNAIKYSEPDSKIEVNYRKENNQLIFSVKDYGQGIPDNQKEMIFNRYYRSPATKKKDGLGLGLYLSKEIVDIHGGRVWVESKEGEGSVFFFSIPLS